MYGVRAADRLHKQRGAKQRISDPSEAVSGAVSASVPVGGTIGVCIYKFDDAFMTTYRTVLEATLKEKGYQVLVVDSNNDQAKQNEQINNFITQKVDALIINPVMTPLRQTPLLIW